MCRLLPPALRHDFRGSVILIVVADLEGGVLMSVNCCLHSDVTSGERRVILIVILIVVSDLEGRVLTNECVACCLHSDMTCDTDTDSGGRPRGRGVDECVACYCLHSDMTSGGVSY